MFIPKQRPVPLSLTWKTGHTIMISCTRSSITVKRLFYIVLLIAVNAALSSCGGGSDGTSSGGGQAAPPSDPGGGQSPTDPPAVKVVGPNLNGDWVGFYHTNNGTFASESLTATITHVGKVDDTLKSNV